METGIGAQLRQKLEREQYDKAQAEQGYYANECAMPQRPMSDEEILADLFRYHPPTPFTEPKFKAVNQAAKNFAEVVLTNCPPGVDRATAIAWIRNARMFANSAISLNGLELR